MAAPMRSCAVYRNHILKSVLGHQCRQSFSKIAPIGCKKYIENIQTGIHVKVPIYSSLQQTRSFQTSKSYLCAEAEKADEEVYHSIIKDTEKSKGPADKHEFQAETRKLLDIVSRSLYSEKEVFIRELISNASDALEKLRYQQNVSIQPEGLEVPLEIHIGTDESKKTITIQDTGVGMTKEDMMQYLGTIAKSGSKGFIDSLEDSADANKSIIGQFGVGFYSSFMVGHEVEVYSRHYKGSEAYKWVSDGTGTYELCEAEGVQRGTKIVIHLKGECQEFSKEPTVKGVIEKYSNFVSVPIYLNGKRVNVVEPLWMLDPSRIIEGEHEAFYGYLTGNQEPPRYHLHYKTDAPLNIRALFYVPGYSPNMLEKSPLNEVSLQLYSKKVMVLSKANTILPQWLRFVKGVVDSEDIPLNLSRELLQDSSLVRKLNQVLTSRLLKFFKDQSKKDPEKFQQFYQDFGFFLKEGCLSTPEQQTREDIAKLFRYESSKLPAGQKTSLEEYSSRLKAGSRTIYYLSAPNRDVAEGSPYLEAMRKKDVEVLFLYDFDDEFVLLQLQQFDRKNLTSIENEVGADKDDKDEKADSDTPSADKLEKSEEETLVSWLKGTLVKRAYDVKTTNRLESHPCVISAKDLAHMREVLKRTDLGTRPMEEKLSILQPTLEINTSHNLIKKLSILQKEDAYLAKLLAEQLYDTALVNAGLMDNPRSMVNRLNQLLEKALDKV